MDTPLFDELNKMIEGQTRKPSPVPRHRVEEPEQLELDYEYTDPVADPEWDRITDPGDHPIQEFPEDWGSRFTERDMAAVVAGSTEFGSKP